ncbi:MAG: hypothetical protein HY313_04715 [Acidobacteria bacterium]|nr:hypothetical protein [Acidobacteriota bacterium]
MELLIVISLALVIAGIAVPNFVSVMRTFRIQGNARDIRAEILLAKMRAAGNFTRARVRFDHSARTWSTEAWNKTLNQWVRETVGAPQYLSTGISFGFGTVSGPPPGTQIVLEQAPPCKTGAANNPGGGSDIANTSCVIFNSRGIPVDSSGAPYNDYAIYVADGRAVYGTTISVTGLIRSWRIEANSASANWQRR